MQKSLDIPQKLLQKYQSQYRLDLVGIEPIANDLHQKKKQTARGQQE